MELIARIEPTDFCLTFDVKTGIISIKHYILEDDDTGGFIAQTRVPGSLDKVTPRSQPMSSLKSKIDTCNVSKIQVLDKKQFKNNMDDALMRLQDKWFEWIDGAEERAEAERLEREEEEQERIEELVSEGHEIIDEMKHPMLCIAWLMQWLTAGETPNIMYAFLAYSSQIILKNPISVIGIGEGGSGKTHIQDVALSLIPEEYVMTIKSTTEAALFGYCQDDPYQFDGKIVNIGDMGGKNDHSESQDFKNAMKEMQSDGYMARVKQVKDPETGDFKNQIFELYGRPCLTYTNVPGFDFEDQEKSRSIFFQPRSDNDKSVSIFKQLHRMKGTPTEAKLKEWTDKIPDIKKMIIALRHRMGYVSIFNPYNTFMEKYLGTSKYFKRDVDKYDGILRIITAINGYRRPLVNDDSVLLTTKEDISIFIDILERYHESITSNVSPGAADLLHELRENADNWDLYDGQLSVNDYLYKSSRGLFKKTAQNYFGELNTEGYLKVAHNENRANYYKLTSATEGFNKNDIELSEMDKKILTYNFGDEVYDILNTHLTPLNIFEPPQPQPVWNDLLP